MKRCILFIIIVSIFFSCIAYADNTQESGIFTYEDIKSIDSSLTPTEVDYSCENIAQNAVLSMSSFGVDGTDSVCHPEKLKDIIDGNREKRVILTDYFTHSGEIIFEYENSVEFNKIILYDYMCTNEEISILVSDDGNHYESIYHFDRNEVGWKEDEIVCIFETQTKKFIKIFFEDIGSPGIVSNTCIDLTEIEIYNVSSDTHRLDSIIKTANQLITKIEKNNIPVFPDKLTALNLAITSAINAKESTLPQYVIEENTWNIRNKLLDLAGKLNYGKEEYEKIINRRKKEIFSTSESAMTNALNLSNSLMKDNSSILWENIGSVQDAIEYTKSFNDYTIVAKDPIGDIISNITVMANAVCCPDSRLYLNEDLLSDTLYAMDIFKKYWYGSEVKRIGVYGYGYNLQYIRDYSDVFVMMYGVIDYDILYGYANDIKKTLSSGAYYNTGTNLMNILWGYAKLGAVLREDALIVPYTYYAEKEAVIKNTDFSGNGYYSDGSAIFHQSIPYAGTYVRETITLIIRAITLTESTPWAVHSESMNTFLYTMAKEAYLPLMVRGNLMSMVNGRNVTNDYNSEKRFATNAAYLIQDIANILGEPQKTELLSMVKAAYEGSSVQCPVSYSGDKAEEMILNKVYNYQDRVVHHRPDWSMGLSMSSTRIGMYECTNRQNKKGWLLGSGVTYFYDSDDTQYSNEYFRTVDPLKLPGVTAVQKELPIVNGQQHLNKYSFAGGVSLNDLYGSAAMKTGQKTIDLYAQKAYFMFDDEVVMLGSGISSGDEDAVTATTVEQRRVDNDNSENVYINGKNLNAAKVENEVFTKANTAWIKGRGNSAFGYYFPGSTELTVDKGYKERDISDTYLEDSGTVSGTYATLYLDHGTKPENAKYSYAVLPGKTVAETEEYKNNPDYRVLANNDKYCAVYEKTLGITAMVNFCDENASAGALTVDKQSVCMLSENEKTLRFAISDPTQENNGVINVVLNKQAAFPIKLPSNVTVKSLSPSIELEIDMANTYGKGVEIVFSKTALPEFSNKKNFLFVPDDLSKPVTVGPTQINKPFFAIATKPAEYSGYSLSERGIIISSNKNNVTLGEGFVCRSVSPLSYNNYAIIIYGDLNSMINYYVRNYAVYTDGDGQKYTVYGEIEPLCLNRRRFEVDFSNWNILEYNLD